ncbi:MAG: PEP-CTERM sorting domain-containing protein, partial [Phycisphaerae bacterium]
VVATTALAATLAFITPAKATLVSVVLGSGGSYLTTPPSGTVAAAPSNGSNEWNGFGINSNSTNAPYSLTFSPLDSNGGATQITGTFVETNPVGGTGWQYTQYTPAPSGGVLPPFKNWPAASWNGQNGTDESSPSSPIGPDTLTLSGLSSTGRYNVYVYSAYAVGSTTDGNTPTVSLTLTEGTGGPTSYTYTYNMGDPNLLASYQLGTNYEEFQNVTPDSSGAIAIAGTGVNTSLFNAFQLYAVPEPATVGLFAVGGVTLLLIGRRRAARRST